jgi:large subunit ribosomal protein L5
MSRLKQRFVDEIKPALIERFGYTNPMMAPRLQKIVISMGIAEAAKDKNAVQDLTRELSELSGQKPILSRAKKAISNFKLRKGQIVGLKVTLRGNRMYDFLHRFCNISAPRIRDFHGFTPKCDGRGSFSLGLEDQQIFPELNLDLVKRPQGMNITFVTSAATDDECVELLRLLGMPFKGLPVVVSGWS